jgi:hypothetical protein
MCSCIDTYPLCVEEVRKGIVPEEYSGIVDSTYRSPINRACIVELHGGEKISFSFYPLASFESINPGDYIVKRRGNTWLLIYRRGAEVRKIYPECDDGDVIRPVLE